MKGNTKIYSILILLFIFGSIVSILAQTREQRSLLREGNKLYKDKKYNPATDKYRESLNIDPVEHNSSYGIGACMYNNKAYHEADSYFDVSAINAKNRKDIAFARYNQGNAFMEQKKYKEAITAYKSSLKQLPDNTDAKYNLSYALKKLEQEKKDQEKQKQDQKNQDQKDNKDQDKKDGKDKKDDKDGQDKKDQDKKDGKDKKDQDKKDGQDKKDKGDKDKKPMQARVSKEDADRILNALKNEEAKAQRKMMLQSGNKKDQQDDKKQIEKEW